MAAAVINLESFSIREYASKMRSVDVVKCWPFGEEADTVEKMKEMLPVITVKKFRWWLDELEKINKGNDEEDDESPGDSENLASIRRKSRLLKKMKSKGKTPKKRSIVELFAVAPEVERPISNVDEVDDDNEVENKQMKNDFNKKKKKGITMKEKICKFKSIPSHNSTPNPSGFDDTLIHSKKTKVKNILAADAKVKARRTSQLITKNHFQSRGGMLKGLTKERLSENKISLQKIQNLNKKYALLIKDDVREGSRPQMESDFLKHSYLRHADIEKSVSIQEMEEIEKETYKWRANHINMVPPFECVKYHGNEVPCRSKLLNRSVPSFYNDNLVRYGEYDRREEHDAPLLHPRSTGTLLLRVYDDVDARASSSSRSVDYFKPYPQSFHSHSSTPNNSSVNSNPQFPLKKFGEDYNELSLQRPRRPLMSPKELMRTVCCIPDQRSTMQMYGERSISDDLFGLPLNSQGELIRYGGMYQRGGGPNVPSESGIGSFSARQEDRYTAFPKSDLTQHSWNSMQLSPSTMRLMGQEFRVDGRGFRRPENRELYKDKEIMEDQHVDNTPVYGSSQFLSESVKGGPECIRMHSSEEYNGSRASSGYPSHTMAPKSETVALFDDQKGTHGFSKGYSPHDTYPHANFVSRGHINSILPENSSGYRPQSLVPAMVFHDTCRNTSKSRLQPAKHMQMTGPFPVRPLSLDRSSKVIPPGCFEARERELVMDYNQAFGCSDSCVHPPLTTPMINQRTNSFPHHVSRNTSASASSMIHHPFLPVHSSLKEDDYVEKLKYQNHGNTTKKRLASTISNQYIKSNNNNKMPRSSVSLEDFTSTAKPVKVVNNYTRQNLNWDIQKRGLGSHSASGKYKPHTVGYGEKNEKNPRMMHYRSSGPVKPTAGAKHVLKPYQRNEPSILTTPFAANQPAGVISQIMKP